MENGTDADSVYLGFAKAFDSVPYSRLICDLHNYGISGNLLEDNKFEEIPPSQIGKMLLAVFPKVAYLT